MHLLCITISELTYLTIGSFWYLPANEPEIGLGESLAGNDASSVATYSFVLFVDQMFPESCKEFFPFALF